MKTPRILQPPPGVRRYIWPLTLDKRVTVKPGESLTMESFAWHDAYQRTIEIEALLFPASFLYAGGRVSRVEVPTGTEVQPIILTPQFSGTDCLRLNLSNVKLHPSEGITITIENGGSEPIAEIRGLALVFVPPEPEAFTRGETVGITSFPSPELQWPERKDFDTMDETDDTKNRHDLRPLSFLLAEQRKRLVRIGQALAAATARRPGPDVTGADVAELLELGHEIAVYAAIGSASLSPAAVTHDDLVGGAELAERLVKIAKDL